MASPNTKRNVFFKLAVLLEALIILLIAIVFVFVFFIRGRNEAVPVSEDAPEVRTRAVIEKEETFYQLDGKKILMHDSTLGEVFVPVYSDVPVSTVNPANITSLIGDAF